MKKKCTKCKEEKCISEFNKNCWKKDGLQTKCRPCSRQQSKDHYQNNKQYYMKKSLVQRDKCKEVYLGLKSNPCMDCKKSYPPCVMDYDHRHSKKYNVSRLIAHGGMAKLLNEISKCDLVCSNCHRIRTSKRMGM